jgi:hypothetical protein
MTVLAVFRPRAHSLHYAERLQAYGVPAVTVPTPKEARIGCGLCVRFDARYFPRAEALLKTARYASFKGFYKMDFLAGQLSLTPFVKK